MAASRAWLIAATLGLAGCRFDAERVDGYRCGADGACPSGSMCVDGFCVSETPLVDAEPGGDPDAAPAVQGCGGLALLRDDFATVARDPQWDYFEDPGATVVEAGGHLAISLTGGAGGPYAGYLSGYRYDLTDSAITVEVSAVAGHNTILEVRNYEGDRVQMVAGDTQLVAAVFGGPNQGEPNAIPYDAVAQRWWRLRESAGTLTWEYSANGTAWTELASVPDPIALDHVRGVLAAGDALATTTEARFETLNPDAPTAGFCAASTLVDPFTAGLEPNWQFWEDACDLVEVGGRVQMTYPTGDGDAWCGFGSNHLYDLTLGDLYLDAQGVANATNFVNYFQVIDPSNDERRAEIGREGDTIAFVQRIDGTDVDTDYQTYDATDDRYWKLGASGGDVTYETSPDATTWTRRMTVPAMFDLDQVRVIIGAGHYAPGPGSPVTTNFQGVNTP